MGDLSNYGVGSGTSGAGKKKTTKAKATGKLSGYGVGSTTNGKNKAPAKKPAVTPAPTKKPISALGGRSYAGAGKGVDKKTKTKLQADFDSAISIGQATLNTLSTPGYFVENALLNGIKGTGGKDIGSFLSKSWSDATAWQRGKEVKTGVNILAELGYVDALQKAYAQGPKSIGYVKGRGGYATAPASPEVAAFVSGLALDIALDPLTYIPVFGWGAKAVKIAATVGDEAIKAANLIRKGAVPLKKATEKLGKEAVKELPVTKKTVKGARIKPQNLRPVGEVSEAVSKQQEARAKITGKYATEWVTPPNLEYRSKEALAKEMVATALTAGYKAAAATIVSNKANKFLENYAKKEAKGLLKPGQTVSSAATEASLKSADEVLPTTPDMPTTEQLVTDPISASIKVSDSDPATRMIDNSLATDKVEIEKAQQALTAVEKIVKGIRGTSGTADEIIARVKNALSTRDIAISEFVSKKANPAVRKLLDEGLKMEMGYTPFDMVDSLREMARTGTGAKAQHAQLVLKAFDEIPVETAGGERLSLGALRDGGTDFFSLPRATQVNIVGQLKNFLNSDAQGALNLKRDAVAKIVSPDVLKQIEATNVFDATKATDREKLLKVVENISQKNAGTEVRYGNFLELVAGLRAGDDVPYANLSKIIKALDPEQALGAKLAKGADKSSLESLKMILIGTGTGTMKDFQRRIMLADPKVFLESTGLGFVDATWATFDRAVLDPTFFDESIQVATRQAAGERVARSGSSMYEVADTIAGTLERRFGEKVDILKQAESAEGVSTLNDLYVRSTALPYQEGTKVVLYNNYNQSFQAALGASFGGKATYKAVKKSGGTGGQAGRASRYSEIMANYMSANDMLLAATGTRLHIAKEAIEAKGDIDLKHIALIDMGDIMYQFSKTDEGLRIGMDALVNANKYDSLDFVSVLKTTRQVLENREKGYAHDIDALLQTLGRIQKTEEKSQKFLANKDKIAREFLDYLITEAAPKLEEIHIQRASAMVQDWTRSAVGISDDIGKLMFKAWEANYSRGFTNDKLRFEAVQDLFNRFIYMSDTLNQADPLVAGAVAKAASMIFIRGGKLAKLGDEALSEEFKLVPGAKDALYQDMQEAINIYYQKVKPEVAPPKGRERTRKPSGDQQSAALSKFEGAKDAYSRHLALRETISTTAEYKKWQTTFKRLQTNLDKARADAWLKWLPTQHWDDLNGKWIPSEEFNHTESVARAEQNPAVFLRDGAINRGASEVDSIPVTPKTPKSTSAQKKADLKAAKDKQEKHDVAVAESRVQDAAAIVLESVAKVEKLDLTEVEQAERLLQEEFLITIKNGELKSYLFNPTYGKSAVDGVEQPGFLSRVGEKVSSTATRKDVKQAMTMQEVAFKTAASDVARLMHQLHDKYVKLMKPEDYMKSIQKALNDNMDISGEAAEIQQLAGELKQVLDQIKIEMQSLQVDPEILRRAFDNWGLNKANGFNFPEDMDNLENMWKEMPFAPMPDFIQPGTSEAVQFAKSQKAFMDSGIDPFMLLARMTSAVQFIKAEKNLAMDLVARFSYRAEGISAARAAKDGYVELSALPGRPQTIMQYIPNGENGGLFHPEIAKQIASLTREWHAVMYSKNLPKYVGAMMELTAFVKANQTILNLRHHATNFVGDVTASLIGGTRNPAHWAKGLEIALEAAGQVLRTEWTKGKLDENFIRLFRNFGAPEDGDLFAKSFTRTGKNTTPIMVGGQTLDVPNAVFRDRWMKHGILTNSQFNDELTNIRESVLVDAATATGDKKKARSVILTKVKLGWESAIKPAGDYAAAYGNIPRAADAIRFATSRSRKSWEEMDSAILEFVSRYHPTIQSLASAERKVGRTFSTYYTWQRIAHIALIDMAINRTAAMLFIPKVLSNLRQVQGIEQISPGTPWEDKRNAPDYYTYSVYGPVMYDTNYGRVVMKTSTLPLDILDNYQFVYDPVLSASDQESAWNTAFGKLIGSNINIIVERSAENIFGVSMRSGEKVYDRTTAGALQRTASDFGLSQLLKGLGFNDVFGVPLANKEITPRDQELARINWVTGAKMKDVDTAANKKNAVEQLNSRIKSYQEKLANKETK